MYLNRDDGFIKVYEMSSGQKGALLNPSLGWQYIQNITLNDTKKTSRHIRLGSKIDRTAIKGSEKTLTIGTWQVGGDEFSFINDNKEYIFELLFYEHLRGDPESSAQVYELGYCTSIDRGLTSGAKANTVTRKWAIGQISDQSISELSAMKLAIQDVPFTNETTIEIGHSLAVKKAWVMDSSGFELDVPIQVTSSLIAVDFTRQRSGTLYYLYQTADN